MTKIRIKKSRDSDRYSHRLKSSTSTANKHSIRAEKERLGKIY